MDWMDDKMTKALELAGWSEEELEAGVRRVEVDNITEAKARHKSVMAGLLALAKDAALKGYVIPGSPANMPGGVIGRELLFVGKDKPKLLARVSTAHRTHGELDVYAVLIELFRDVAPSDRPA